MHEALQLPIGQNGAIWHHASGPHRRSPHRHDEVEFNLVTRGRAAYLIGERRYELQPRTLIWLFPGQEHVLLEESPDHAMWIGVFTPALIRRVGTTPEAAVLAEADPHGWFCRTLSEERVARLHALLSEVSLLGDDAAHLNAGLEYLLLSAWVAYQAAEIAPGGYRVHPGVECAIRLLREDPEALSLERLAQAAGLSPSRLSRLFRRQIGVPLTEFRNAQRLDRFFRLYGRGQYQGVTEAALEAGFGSYPQFHRVFRGRMGCSPVQYFRRAEEKESL